MVLQDNFGSGCWWDWNSCYRVNKNSHNLEGMNDSYYYGKKKQHAEINEKIKYLY